MQLPRHLDDSQRAFCEATPGNIRLIAPAGCGKTMCLLYRCSYLADRSLSKKQRFLIVTFTRAARDELLTRLNEHRMFATFRDHTEITTLNSWGYRRVRNATFHPKLLTSRTDYHFAMLNQLQPVWQNHDRIRNAIQSKNRWKGSQTPRILMDTLDGFKALGFDHVRHTTLESFSHHWNELECQGLEWRLREQIHQMVRFEVFDDEIVSAGPSVQRSEIYHDFFSFWREATKHLIESATFTLEDQKYYAFQDERANIDKGRKLSGAASYDHILVDEFQDINPLDLALVRAIAERNRATLTIAGDDDQAIFEWRGATPEYILQPDKFLGSPFNTFTLEVNYRSPANIVKHSQQLISNNHRRVPKSIRAHSADNARIEVVLVDELMEALTFLDGLVDRSVSRGESPSRVALIGRKRSQIIPYPGLFARWRKVGDYWFGGRLFLECARPECGRRLRL